MMAKDHILAFIIICSKMFFISFQKVNIHKILSLTALLHLYRILKKIITKILFTITCNEIATKCKKKVTLIFLLKTTKKVLVKKMTTTAKFAFKWFSEFNEEELPIIKLVLWW